MADETTTPTPPTIKNILVTGGAGFIASHVVIRLVKNYPQYNIVNFDRLDYCSCLKNLDCIADAPNYTFVKGNITSSDMVNYVLQVHKIDTIMHFAAQTHVDNSFGNSFQFTENNIMGTHVLLEASKVQGITRFIHVSTDEVYGESSNLPDAAHEGVVLEPTNPYAATKAAAEFLAKAYHRSFDLPVIITRGNNVYGPHQYPEKIIPKFINQLLRGRACTLHGDGSNQRNYLFVEDVAAAFDTVLHNGEAGAVYNIGGTNEFTNLEVAHKLLAALNLSDQADTLLTFVEDRAFNDYRYHIESSKLRDMGWREEVSFEDGLARTVEWYKLYSGNWGNIESALVAHPRQGALPEAYVPPKGAAGADAEEAKDGAEAASAPGQGN